MHEQNGKHVFNTVQCAFPKKSSRVQEHVLLKTKSSPLHNRIQNELACGRTHSFKQTKVMIRIVVPITRRTGIAKLLVKKDNLG